jgi:hypothetical protein
MKTLLHPTMPRPSGSTRHYGSGENEHGESAEQGVYSREITLNSVAPCPYLAHVQSFSETMIHLSSSH